MGAKMQHGISVEHLIHVGVVGREAVVGRGWGIDWIGLELTRLVD